MAAADQTPLPRPLSPESTRPFWEAASRSELVRPRGKNRVTICPSIPDRSARCLANHVEWMPVSGQDRLHAYMVVYQPANAACRDDTPYIYAVVQLDEWPRIVSNAVPCEIDDVRVDMPLEAIFDDLTPERTLVKFTRASRHASPGLRRLGEHLCAPGLTHGSIGLDETESSLIRKKVVHVGIADVVVDVGLEPCLHLGESVLQYREVDGDVVLLPDTPLITQRAV